MYHPSLGTIDIRMASQAPLSSSAAVLKPSRHKRNRKGIDARNIETEYSSQFDSDHPEEMIGSNQYFESERKRRILKERAKLKAKNELLYRRTLHGFSFIWDRAEEIVLSAVLVAILYFTRLIPILWSDDRIIRPFLRSGLIALLLCAIMGFYVGIWLPKVRQIVITDWMSYFPLQKFLMTSLAIFSGICFFLSLWPIYGNWSPILLSLLLVIGSRLCEAVSEEISFQTHRY